MPLISAISLGLLALILGLGLGLAAKKFGVKHDEKEEKILNILPGINCGACGYAGCQAFASALVAGEADVAGCPAGGSEVHCKIAEVLGIKFEAADSKVAVVRCMGTLENAGNKFIYRGVETCTAAGLFAGGPKACGYGCLGYGDCVKACPFQAIVIRDGGIPVVLEDKCTACGACVKACPRDIIELVPRKRHFFIGCVSRDKGKEVKDVCKVGCIACGICAKLSPEGAVIMEDNLPLIKTDKDEDIEKGAEKCPVKIILRR